MELYKDKEWLKSKLDKTNLEIAKECGCSKSTIRYWIEKFGLSRNDKGINTYKNKEWLEEKFKTLKYAKTIGNVRSAAMSMKAMSFQKTSPALYAGSQPLPLKRLRKRKMSAISMPELKLRRIFLKHLPVKARQETSTLSLPR